MNAKTKVLPVVSTEKHMAQQQVHLKALHEAVHKCKRALHGTGSNQVGVPGIRTSLDVCYVTLPDGSMTIRERDQSSYEVGD